MKTDFILFIHCIHSAELALLHFKRLNLYGTVPRAHDQGSQSLCRASTALPAYWPAP